MSSHIYKSRGEGGEDVSTHVFEKIKDRRVSHRRADDRAVASGERGIYDDAYLAGFTEGKKAGEEAGKKEAALRCQGLEGLIAEIRDFKKTLFSECEAEAVKLCMNIAKKVIQRELSMREDSVVYVVKEALKAAVTNGKIRIRLNPGDMSIIKEHGKELKRYTQGFSGVSLDGDEGVTSGGCIIETGSGEVDATIEGLLDEVQGILNDS